MLPGRRDIVSYPASWLHAPPLVSNDMPWEEPARERLRTEERWANTSHLRLPWPKRSDPAQGRVRDIHDKRTTLALSQVLAQKPTEKRWANPLHKRPLWPSPGPIPDCHERASKEDLAHAIAEQDIKEVTQLANTGAPVLASYALDRTGENMGTALEFALLKKKSCLATEMLALPADGPKLARGSTRAVVWAVRDGRVQLLKELLGARADASQCDSQGRSALLLASTFGHAECVHALLQAGAGEREANMDQVQRLFEMQELKPVLDSPCRRDKMPNNGDLGPGITLRDELTLLNLDLQDDRWGRRVHERLPWRLRKG